MSVDETTYIVDQEMLVSYNQTITEFKGLTKNLYEGIQLHKKSLTIFLIVLFSVCVCLMVVASIWDYQIAHALNNPYEWYSWFLQDFGEWPAPFIVNCGFFVVMFVWLIRTRKKGNYLFLLFLLPLAGAFIFGYFFTYGVLVDTWWIALIIATIGIGAFTTIAFLLPKQHLVKILYFLMLCFIIANLAYFLMLFVKWLWGRVRFRDIGGILDPDIGFTHWFIINGPNGNEAFFSGHVLAALSFTYVWMIPPIFNIKNKIVIGLMYGLSSFYAISMMYGRIVTGAHYLSDVVTSVIVYTVFTILILTFIFFRNLRKKRND
ncbi:MAG: phosphatase PAP2 family protein [Firmicutes bacterium]|nr:phosphatase PAP2 family protein [Bacillota bacterium]